MRPGAAFAEPGWRVGTFGSRSFSVLTISLMMMEMPLLLTTGIVTSSK